MNSEMCPQVFEAVNSENLIEPFSELIDSCNFLEEIQNPETLDDDEFLELIQFINDDKNDTVFKKLETSSGELDQHYSNDDEKMDVEEIQPCVQDAVITMPNGQSAIISIPDITQIKSIDDIMFSSARTPSPFNNTVELTTLENVTLIENSPMYDSEYVEEASSKSPVYYDSLSHLVACFEEVSAPSSPFSLEETSPQSSVIHLQEASHSPLHYDKLSPVSTPYANQQIYLTATQYYPFTPVSTVNFHDCKIESTSTSVSSSPASSTQTCSRTSTPPRSIKPSKGGVNKRGRKPKVLTDAQKKRLIEESKNVHKTKNNLSSIEYRRKKSSLKERNEVEMRILEEQHAQLVKIVEANERKIELLKQFIKIRSN